MKRRVRWLVVFLTLGVLVNLAAAWSLALWGGLQGNPPGNALTSINGAYISDSQISFLTINRRLGGMAVTCMPFWSAHHDGGPRPKWSVEGDSLVISSGTEGIDVHANTAGGTTTFRLGGRLRVDFGPERTVMTPDSISPSLLPAWSAAFRSEKSTSSASKPISIDRAWGWPMLAMRHQMQSQDWKLRNPVIRGGYIFQPLPLTVLPLTLIWPGFLVDSVFYAAALWAAIRGPIEVRRIVRRRRKLCPWCGYPIGASPVCTECGEPVI